MAFTDALKAQIKQEYLDANPTPETSVEIVKELAETHGQTANAVRMFLMQAEVYVKKDAAATSASKTSSTKASGEGSKRVSKEDSINALKEALRAAGKDVDDDILDKLTGKAAVYFAGLFK
jgi:KaiC/GvpD/RAD55 family RecA-like ATPase